MLFAASEPVVGPGARTVRDRLADRGFRVITVRTGEGLRSTIAVHRRGEAAAGLAGAAGPGATGAGATDPAASTPPASTIPIGAALLSWEFFSSPGEMAAVLAEIQQLSAPPPVVVISEEADERAVPPELAHRAAGSFWLHADSPHFVADQVEWLIHTYALRSQVLRALAAGISNQADAGIPCPRAGN
ncbi:MAG: Orn/Lys/Arg decarboxylase N-terminal domain-containing protein [Streptosporangiaceae bacterium]